MHYSVDEKRSYVARENFCKIECESVPLCKYIQSKTNSTIIRAPVTLSHHGTSLLLPTYDGNSFLMNDIFSSDSRVPFAVLISGYGDREGGETRATVWT